MELRQVFARYSLFITLLKIDAQLAVVNLCAEFIFFFDKSWQNLLAIILLVSELGMLAFGYHGARMESKGKMVVFFSLSLFGPAYQIYHVTDIFVSEKDAATNAWKPAVVLLCAVRCLLSSHPTYSRI